MRAQMALDPTLPLRRVRAAGAAVESFGVLLDLVHFRRRGGGPDKLEDRRRLEPAIYPRTVPHVVTAIVEHIHER